MIFLMVIRFYVLIVMVLRVNWGIVHIKKEGKESSLLVSYVLNFGYVGLQVYEDNFWMCCSVLQ